MVKLKNNTLFLMLLKNTQEIFYFCRHFVIYALIAKKSHFFLIFISGGQNNRKTFDFKRFQNIQPYFIGFLFSNFCDI